MGEQTETPKRLEGLLFAAINVAANEVPIVGSIFNEVRLYRANEVMQRRLATLVEEVKEQMKTVKETTVDWEFMRSEVFFDLVRQAVEVALRTRDRQKTEFVARVLRERLWRRGGVLTRRVPSLISD